MQEVKEWKKRIDLVTSQFTKISEGLSSEELSWNPITGQWSILQNIQHLITVNESYFPIFNQLRSGNYKAPFMGKFGFITSFMGSLILKSIKPENAKPVKTFNIWQPRASPNADDILGTFSAHQDTLKEKIRSVEQLLNKGTVIASPASKQIVYTLDKALEIIVSHEERHLKQSKQVLNSLRQKEGQP